MSLLPGPSGAQNRGDKSKKNLYKNTSASSKEEDRIDAKNRKQVMAQTNNKKGEKRKNITTKNSFRSNVNIEDILKQMKQELDHNENDLETDEDTEECHLLAKRI